MAQEIHRKEKRRLNALFLIWERSVLDFMKMIFFVEIMCLLFSFTEMEYIYNLQKQGKLNLFLLFFSSVFRNVNSSFNLDVSSHKHQGGGHLH